MKKVKIGELKTHLSAHLKKVKIGEEIIVLDRDEPIAKLIPFNKNDDNRLIVIPPKIKGALKGFKFTGPRLKTDVVKLLHELREDKI
ncbi:MAG: type II toxin-antitoxin system Phd/YefM family antitoxin [Deltaproteobacteria bacterium]|nr:type II toxin-antitoxin system Phd/YefM family antitoxin [Deltaproteobacteria bacterium]